MYHLSNMLHFFSLSYSVILPPSKFLRFVLGYSTFSFFKQHSLILKPGYTIMNILCEKNHLLSRPITGQYVLTFYPVENATFPHHRHIHH